MSNITKTMLSCEDLSDKIANNFRNIGNEFKSMGLVGRIEYELRYDNTLAGVCIKQAILENKSTIQIVRTCADQIKDGWKGLSENLSKDILNF